METIPFFIQKYNKIVENFYRVNFIITLSRIHVNFLFQVFINFTFTKKEIIYKFISNIFYAIRD